MGLFWETDLRTVHKLASTVYLLNYEHTRADVTCNMTVALGIVFALNSLFYNHRDPCSDIRSIK